MTSQLHQDKYEGKGFELSLPILAQCSCSKHGFHTISQKKEIVNNGYRIYTELDKTTKQMQVIYEATSLFPIAEDGTHAESRK